MNPPSPAPEPRKMSDLETALLHLLVILPMAKGYASANPVGNNWKMVEEAYAFANELNERSPAPAPTLADAAAIPAKLDSDINRIMEHYAMGEVSLAVMHDAIIVAIKPFVLSHLSGHQQAAGMEGQFEASGNPRLTPQQGQRAKKIYQIVSSAIIEEAADLEESSVIQAVALELHDYASSIESPAVSQAPREAIERLTELRRFIYKYSWDSGEDVRDEVKEILNRGHNPECDFVCDNPEGIQKPCNCGLFTAPAPHLSRSIDLSKVRVQLLTPTPADPFAREECTITDIGHADLTLIVSVSHLSPAPDANDSAILDWLLNYITNKGTKGFAKLTWSLYDEDGKSLNDCKRVSEDEVHDMRFDRSAIRAAMRAEGEKKL